MTAVANNPKFAKKTGVPQSVGEKYVKADKKMKKYQAGGKTSVPGIGKTDEELMRAIRGSDVPSPEKEAELKRKMKEDEMDRNMEEGYKRATGKMKDKPKKMMGGGMAKYKKGGSVRGAGCAKKGVRPCKMR